MILPLSSEQIFSQSDDAIAFIALHNLFHKVLQNHNEKERILQADIFIENLPDKEKELVENYIKSFTSQFAFEEVFLYQHGFIDSINFQILFIDYD